MLPGELVDDVQQLEHMPVGGLIELEIERPHVAWALSAQPSVGCGRGAQPAALARAPRHPQALLAPQALHALAIDLPTLIAQMRVRLAIAPPRPPRRERTQLAAQRLIVGRRIGLATLRGTMLSDDLTRPALADMQAVAKHRDRRTPTGWAHQFPFATSLSACTSST